MEREAIKLSLRVLRFVFHRFWRSNRRHTGGRTSGKAAVRPAANLRSDRRRLQATAADLGGPTGRSTPVRPTAIKRSDRDPSNFKREKRCGKYQFASMSIVMPRNLAKNSRLFRVLNPYPGIGQVRFMTSAEGKEAASTSGPHPSVTQGSGRTTWRPRGGHGGQAGRGGADVAPQRHQHGPAPGGHVDGPDSPEVNRVAMGERGGKAHRHSGREMVAPGPMVADDDYRHGGTRGRQPREGIREGRRRGAHRAHKARRRRGWTANGEERRRPGKSVARRSQRCGRRVAAAAGVMANGGRRR
uniref:Uncharacterized protein n=1 Tax=Oryza sativa subsp. japonica TaxID=39947 RepID=Q652R8_ORYSJ|nr:hypothetical protein [Oryza sativa Japonica Group]